MQELCIQDATPLLNIYRQAGHVVWCLWPEAVLGANQMHIMTGHPAVKSRRTQCPGVSSDRCLCNCRRHVSLLRSLVADAESSVLPYHTIVEVYRVAPHMPLMRVLPSAADEVNAALFHPFKVSAQCFFIIPAICALNSSCSCVSCSG